MIVIKENFRNEEKKNRMICEYYSDVWGVEVDEETIADWYATGEVEEQDFGHGDIWYSVKLHNKNDGLDYWLDSHFDKYGELDADWNQYIFYNTRTDNWRERVQDNIANFDSAMGLVDYEVDKYLASKNKDKLKENYWNRSKVRAKKKYNHR